MPDDIVEIIKNKLDQIDHGDCPDNLKIVECSTGGESLYSCFKCQARSLLRLLAENGCVRKTEDQDNLTIQDINDDCFVDKDVFRVEPLLPGEKL